MSDTQPQLYWALTVTLKKVISDGWKTTTTERSMLGWMEATTEDEAVGKFLRKCQKENPGYMAGTVLLLQLPFVLKSDE